MKNIFIFLFVYKVLSLNETYNFSCPSQAHWNLRAKSMCILQRSYTCLYHVTFQVNVYREECRGPRSLPRGSKYVFQPDFNNATCRENRYQPLIFNTIGYSDCVFLKSICNSNGQSTYGNGNRMSDRTCSCNTDQGYTFVVNSKNPCYCNPSTEDCSCYFDIHTKNRTTAMKDLKCYDAVNITQIRSDGEPRLNKSQAPRTNDDLNNYKYNISPLINANRTTAVTIVSILVLLYIFVALVLGIYILRLVEIQPPENFDIVDFTDRSLSVKWYINDSDNSLDYQLDHRILGSDEWISLALPYEHISTNEDGCQVYKLQELLHETFYEMRMCSVDNHIKSTYTEHKTQKTLQLAPTHFEIVKCTDRSISVEWDIHDSDICLEYKYIDRHNGTEVWKDKLHSPKDFSTSRNGRFLYKLEKLSPDTLYELKLCYVDNHRVKSFHTKPLSLKTLKVAPKNFDVVECTDRSITIKWDINHSDNWLEYKLVDQLTSPDDCQEKLLSTKDVSTKEIGCYVYKLKHLSPDTCYKLKLCSVGDNQVKSQQTEYKKRKTLKMAPKDFDIFESSDRSITVQWYMDDTEAHQEYELNHRLQNSDNWNVSTFSLENVSTVENGSSIYKLENLSPETCYELKMCLVQNNVKSEYTKNKIQQTKKTEYETDEENRSLCGVCFKEFSSLEALQRHKPSFCRQRTGTSDYDTHYDDHCRCGICFKEFSTLEALQRHKPSFCRQKTGTSVKDITTVSLAFYRYLCENIVGTENHVRTIRRMTNITDDMRSSKHIVKMISGSCGEGLLMRYSDLDVMSVDKTIEVNADVKTQLSPNKASCRMVTDDVKPGFTQLLVENYERKLSDCYEEINGKHYLSSTLFRHHLLRNLDTHIFHGPCISEKSASIDFAMCLHCKTWISQASQWISRSNNSWPSSDVKQRIIKHGVLFLPVGVNGSLTEGIEWRICFSVGEKMLVSTFTHTQLVCYALLKIVLKDVISIHTEYKDLLCSYHLKTIIFWISEELPQSFWKPENLIPCFMRCFSRLIYCVDYSVCLHYFIPENNMFENRIEGLARDILLDKLYNLRRYGWRWLLFSKQLFKLHELILMDHTEPHTLHTIEVEKILNSELFILSNVMAFNIETDAYKRRLHQLLFCNKSEIKHLHAYYMSRWCAQYAQSISLTNTRSNKLQYKQYTSCLCTLIKSIYQEAVSGWLMLASFFYKSKQYNLALRILTYSLSKCPSEELYSFITLSKEIMIVDDISFNKDSWLIPDELQMEANSGRYIFVSSKAYGHFLKFLCHLHLKNFRQCQDSFQKLQIVIDNHYFIEKRKTVRSQAYNILRLASQLLWNHHAARRAV